MADEAETITGLRLIANSYAVILCDVFGVLHDTTGVFQAATEALGSFRAAGGTVVLVSNSAEPGPRLVDSLQARGIRPEFDDLVTSADIARILLCEQDAGRVLHIGPTKDRILFEGLAIELTEVEAADLVICTGYPDADGDLGAILGQALGRGLLMLCTNPDLSLVVGTTRLRFAGLVAERYRALSGVVVETGKPGGLIYREAVERAARARGGRVAPEQVLGIGDTWALDIEGALGAGFSALRIGAAEPQPRPPNGAGRLYRMPALAW